MVHCRFCGNQWPSVHQQPWFYVSLILIIHLTHFDCKLIGTLLIFVIQRFCPMWHMNNSLHNTTATSLFYLFSRQNSVPLSENCSFRRWFRAIMGSIYFSYSKIALSRIYRGRDSSIDHIKFSLTTRFFCVM